MPESSDYREYGDEGLLTDLPLWADDDARLRLDHVCSLHKIPVDVITELVALQRERQHQERAAGIFARFEEILGRVD
jgi:hypothetical protein